MYVLGVLSGMIIAWTWLVFASPHAIKEKNNPDILTETCSHCGRQYAVAPQHLRVPGLCARCA